MLENVQETMGITPPALQKRPELAQHLHLFYQVFQELTGSRSYSQMGYPFPIPISEYVAYFRLYDFPNSDARRYLEKISLIDNCWRNEFSKKLEAQSAQKK